ncbi:Uu.00g115020.m01.CDS01 [Anthostomella pinea]|uniref:Uu.00g115020.m01.CDS01 n=1 Tax=Anthostomella pinea TaxID=933095 RepID=A0AAI8YEA2_9PEZI|nr:Uu.00g115020.m01.CDS01 [Anthostomella pinea]
MSGSSAPAWRRGQASGSGELGDARQPADHGRTHSPSNGGNGFFNNRGGRGRGRGGRRGRDGRGGGDHFFQKNQNQPPVDEASLYNQRDINNHFFSDPEGEPIFGPNSSTFHDSKDHPDELSYLLLFFGANPRWTNDHIVFAKSRLNLLPEFRDKKAEHGEWEVPKLHEQADAPNATEDDGASQAAKGTTEGTQDDNASSVTDEAKPDAAQTSTLDGTPSVQAPTADNDKKPEVDTARSGAVGGDEAPAVETSATETASGEAASASAPIPSSRMKYTDVRKELAANEPAAEATPSVQAAPQATSTSSSRMKFTDVRKELAAETPTEDPVADATVPTQATSTSGSRMKFTDVRKELAAEASDAEAPAAEAAPADVVAPTPAPAPAFVPSNRMKYTDVRLIPPEVLAAEAAEAAKAREEQYGDGDVQITPAEEYYPKAEPFVPSFPAIPPIDYIPAAHNPIAVFEERKLPYSPYPRGGPGGFRFAFTGWFKVSRVNVLAPQSAELVRMQQQKWERRDRFGNVLPTKTRDQAAWKAALGVEWAVVKFEKLGEGEGGEAPPPPAIEKLPQPGRDEADTKGAGDKMAEMSLQDKGTESGDVAGDGSADGGAEGGKEALKEKADLSETPAQKQEASKEVDNDAAPTQSEGQGQENTAPA